ncbi:hypothetical protein HYP85_gp006 [Pseudomonas phage Zuri]|uniref:Uncharacterized protein n=1 Tax=Pseudomonas phage Zuri TaxID=2604899 RepID=A0A5C1K5K6_9CAUD|nr:hypothetical protein HYP85_gp006 [Pseudomonas phage Zuri]QEM41103.1 hypothetical protein Zuri_6 [Pseudomonas phage Zuri]
MKIHLTGERRVYVGSLCKFPNVPSSRRTDDPEKVTCLRCLAIITEPKGKFK